MATVKPAPQFGIFRGRAGIWYLRKEQTFAHMDVWMRKQEIVGGHESMGNVSGEV